MRIPHTKPAERGQGTSHSFASKVQADDPDGCMTALLGLPDDTRVSALNPSGWSPEKARCWAFQVGADPRVRCFDLMELNPSVDVDGRTARLASHLFLTFPAGITSRICPSSSEMHGF